MIPDAIKGQVLWEALYGLGIFGVSFLVASVVVAKVLLPLIGKFTANTKTKLDNYLLAALRLPLEAAIVVQGAYLGLTVISFTNTVQDEINAGWQAAMMAVFFWALQRTAAGLLNWYGSEVANRTQTNWDDQFLPIIRRTTTFLILAIGVLVVLSELGFHISPLLAGLGIGGLAVALALQPTLSNFISGTYVLSDGSIRAGDYIEVMGGPTGTVTEVGWRITKLVSAENNLVTIPNSKLSDSIITNYAQPEPPMIMVLGCGVSYESDLVEVERVCLEVMKDLQGRLPEADKEFAPLVRFNSFGDSNVTFNLVMRGLNRGATFYMKHELTKAIHARFAQERIEMNYPVRKLVFPANGNGASHKVLPGAPGLSRGLIENVEGEA